MHRKCHRDGRGQDRWAAIGADGIIAPADDLVSGATFESGERVADVLVANGIAEHDFGQVLTSRLDTAGAKGCEYFAKCACPAPVQG